MAEGKCGARRLKAGPKLGVGFAGAQPVPGELCHTAEQSCKPPCWCKSMHQCKATHQYNPAAAPARDAAPAPLLLCAHPHPKAARGTHNAVITPQQAVQLLATRFPLVWPPSSDVPPSIPPPVPPSILPSIPASILPSLLPSFHPSFHASIPPSILPSLLLSHPPSLPGMVPIRCPWLCPAPALGPGHLPRETGVPGTSSAGTASADGEVASKDFKSPLGPNAGRGSSVKAPWKRVNRVLSLCLSLTAETPCPAGTVSG